MRALWLCVVLSASTLVAGCGAVQRWLNDNVNINGAQPLIEDDKAVTQVDLIVALVPTLTLPTFKKNYPNCIVATSSGGAAGTQTNPDLSTVQTRTCIDGAFNAFLDDPTNQEIRRNQIVGRLRAASEMACTQFTEHLNSIQADANLITGIFATALSGAGAIVTTANTARALSGSGAIASGARAEFNADIFYKEAAAVVVNAIKAEREKQRTALDQSMTKTIKNYPVSVAVADAFRYNDACSLVGGLATANQSITLAQHPGLDELNRAFLQANLTRVIATNPNLVDSSIIKDDGTGNAATLAGLGVQMGTAVSPSANDPIAAYQSSLSAMISTANGLKTALTQSMTDSIVGSDVSTIVGSLGAPTIPTAADTIVTNASQALATTCQPKAVSALSDLATSRATVAAAQGPNTIPAQLDLAYKQSVADLLASAITNYKNAVVSRLLADQQSVVAAVATYKTSAKAPADQTVLQNAIKGVRSDLTGLGTALNNGTIKTGC